MRRIISETHGPLSVSAERTGEPLEVGYSFYSDAPTRRLRSKVEMK